MNDSTETLNLIPPALSSDDSHELPEVPLISIRPSGRWAALNLSEVWAYRELLFFLIWRDVKVRYKQTVLGAAWAIIQPLCTTIIFTLFFGRLVNMPSDGIPYPLFAFAGLTIWTFFSNAVTNSGNSLVGSSHLITKVYFPRMIIPGAAVGAGLLDLAIASVILLGMMFWYGTPLTFGLLLFPVIILLTALLALGVGMWMSALNVKYRDIRYALPFLIQLWMFATPIIYPTSLVPAKWRWALALNPLTGIIEALRAALFGRPLSWTLLIISTITTLLILVCAAFAFRSMEKSFADVV